MMQNNKYTDEEFNFMFPYAVEGYGANEIEDGSGFKNFIVKKVELVV